MQLSVCRFRVSAQNPDNAVVNNTRYHHLGSTAYIEQVNHRGSAGCIHKLHYDRINVFVIACDTVVPWQPAGMSILVNRGVDSLLIVIQQ